ncbi:MAG: hypothetical protein NC081_08090 [Roseburia sp.]|nr:hypothetical protein [Roseburia sp.]
MMNREVLFARTLEQVRLQAKEQENCISEEQVREAFAQLALSEEQLQMVYDYLRQHKIGIGQPLSPEDYLTREERDYLQDYLEEIAAIPDCSESEKEAITISAMAGDSQAQKRLLELYLKDVPDIASLYAGQGVFLEDLIGEGNVALATGVTMLGSLEAPGEVQGMLGKLMMDAMEDYIRENAEHQAKDRELADRINEIARRAEELSGELRRKVTVEELSEESGLSQEVIRDAMRMSGYKIENLTEQL